MTNKVVVIGATPSFLDVDLKKNKTKNRKTSRHQARSTIIRLNGPEVSENKMSFA
jgi:hypothetical protein